MCEAPPKLAWVSGRAKACVSVAWRGSRSCGTVRIARATSCARGPLMRTTPIPPRTGAVAMATMVSEGENRHGSGTRRLGLVGAVGMAYAATAVANRSLRLAPVPCPYFAR